ncbi:MAG: hypothetical protein A3K10_06425 [Bacteroidetes bacterium RIFCSPLOWO2_12_FULL_31_6]|nr:MAG: hypothetical protein A3K10_06425 [Bacteroidetes bacterium RIFCSPLOWO2_12_FULL_31_6]
MNCPACESNNWVKNGKVNNKQRYKCKSCKAQFLSYDPSSVNFLMMKHRHAIILYLQGMSFREIGKLIGINHTSIFTWIKIFESKLKEIKITHKPEIIQASDLIEMLIEKINEGKTSRFLLINLEIDNHFIIK